MGIIGTVIIASIAYRYKQCQCCELS